MLFLCKGIDQKSGAPNLLTSSRSLENRDLT
jgi:hypothetical protein